LSAYIVALTGASGAVYGIRLIEELIKRGDDVDLVISPSGFVLLKEELGLDLARGGRGGVEKGIRAYIAGQGRKRAKGSHHGNQGKRAGALKYYLSSDLAAPVSSGSALRKAMVICPCSMGTLSRIATGVSSNLIERAADCMLKERRELVLVPRETPLNAIHLENMLRLQRAGAVVLPAMPAFYTKPETIEDMVDFVVGKVLDVLKIENSLYKRWVK
jgi:4-hydroxy-3-polyprenylbenzoate decarboxylase